jgi:hypothetical protein
VITLLAQETIEKKLTTRYPRPVRGTDFSFIQRLRAIFDRTQINKDLFLGYCKEHRTYFLDYEHTNGEIRCPLCDEEWLRQQNLI